jgi:hypothetical protein
MKKLTLSLMIFLVTLVAHSQPLPDSVIVKYKAAKTEKEKGNCLLNHFKQQSLIDIRTKTDILSLKTWFGKQNDLTGRDYTDLGLARVLESSGDYPAALALLFSVLPEFENRKDSFGIWNTYNTIGGTYMAAKDYNQAAI